MKHKYCRYLNSLQNEPLISKQKLFIVKVSHIKDMGLLLIACMVTHDVSSRYPRCQMDKSQLFEGDKLRIFTLNT